LIVTTSSFTRAVRVVKVTVTGFLTAAGERSPDAMVIPAPVTCFPIAPEGAPVLSKSFVVLTLIPVKDPAVGMPMVTPVKTSVYFDPAVGPVDAAATVQVLPETLVEPLNRSLPVAVGAVAAKKLAGHVTVTEPVGMAVVRVNVTETFLVVAPATRSSSSMTMDTSFTWPPRMATELTESVLRMSLVVSTQNDEEQSLSGVPGVGPIFAVNTRLCSTLARGPVVAMATTQLFTPPEVDEVAQRAPPSTAGVLEAANKPTGQVIVTEPDGIGVARVKATVTNVPAAVTAPGTLLPPFIVATVTWPPRVPTEAMSDSVSIDVCTVIPIDRKLVFFVPIVAVLKVIVTICAAAPDLAMICKDKSKTCFVRELAAASKVIVGAVPEVIAIGDASLRTGAVVNNPVG